MSTLRKHSSFEIEISAVRSIERERPPLRRKDQVEMDLASLGVSNWRGRVEKTAANREDRGDM